MWCVSTASGWLISIVKSTHAVTQPLRTKFNLGTSFGYNLGPLELELGAGGFRGVKQLFTKTAKINDR